MASMRFVEREVSRSMSKAVRLLTPTRGVGGRTEAVSTGFTDLTGATLKERPSPGSTEA
jgi:hypothetical protein